jgi:hypothetical protein
LSNEPLKTVPISTTKEQKMTTGGSILFKLDVAISYLHRLIPNVSYLDRDTAFEKASKKFRRTKEIKLKPVIEADLEMDGIRHPIKLPNTPNKGCGVKNDRNNGHTIKVPFNIVEIGNLPGQSKLVSVIPPIIRTSITSNKGFCVSKASTGRLLEQSKHEKPQSINQDMLNVFLVGRPIGYNPEDILKFQNKNKTTEFRNWTADLETDSSTNSQRLLTLEMDQNFGPDTAGDINSFKVASLTPTIEENNATEGHAPVHDFTGMDEIDNLTLKIGLAFD